MFSEGGEASGAWHSSAKGMDSGLRAQGLSSGVRP